MAPNVFNMNKQELFCFLIDDDADDREFFTSALTELDASIKLESAKSAREAIDRLSKSRNNIPDFIFLDLNMQPISGSECLVSLKKIAHIAEVPVVIYSTSLNEKVIYDTLKQGAFDHIEKPAEKKVLCDYLKRLLQIAE